MLYDACFHGLFEMTAFVTLTALHIWTIENVTRPK